METDRADDLIQRIRERAADPETRLDERPSELWASVTSQGLAGLFGMGRSIAQDLGRLLRDGPDDRLTARAEEIERSMTTPVSKPLPEPASHEGIAAAERRLGFVLPPLLKRLYLEVANGGFGPGPGILGVSGGWQNDHGKTIEDLHAEMLAAVQENRQWIWPAGLLPIVDHSGVYVCVDATGASNRVVEFDFEELDDEGRDGGWSRAFSDVAPSFDTWIGEWARKPTLAEREAARQEEARATMTSVPEVTRAYWLSMSPEQRASHGLPEKGWGRALFGEAWGDDPRDGSGEA
jgi:SMI1/KNR4 family protein SUKH-1